MKLRMTRLAAVLAASALTVSLTGPVAAGPLAPVSQQLDPTLDIRWNDLGAVFDQPVWVGSPPHDPDTLFIAERAGAIYVAQPFDLGGVFLDPQPRQILHVGAVSTQSEQGFGAIAFHPDFENNGRMYVHYPDGDGNNVLAEYNVHPTQYHAASSSRRVILEVEQPRKHHNGGEIQFGPDGMLYVGIGDGGGGAGDNFTFAPDPENFAQRLDTHLGKVLRIDPLCCDEHGNTFDEGGEYRVPDDNPFVGVPGAEEEIWALGLRQPWRFSFDDATGDLWLGDVGSLAKEEINWLPADENGLNAGKAANFGWACREGDIAQPAPPDRDCSQAGDFVEPTHAYGRESGCTIIGGYIIHDERLHWLSEAYLYVDFCTAQLRALRIDDDGNVTSDEHLPRSVLSDPVAALAPVSFGQDAAGRLYFVNIAQGNILRLDPVVGALDAGLFG